MQTRTRATTPAAKRPSGAVQVLYGEETNAGASFPLDAASERRWQGAGKVFHRRSGLQVNLEALPLRVMEGEELFYRIVIENPTGSKLREVWLMETWTTDGLATLTKQRNLRLTPLGPRSRHVVERRARFRVGLLSIVVAAVSAPCGPGVFLAGDRLQRLVVRQQTEARRGIRPAA